LVSNQVKVQTFFYQLKELNDYVDWLHGTETKLTEVQLNLGFTLDCLAIGMLGI
jgi:hypothetical protein